MTENASTDKGRRLEGPLYELAPIFESEMRQMILFKNRITIKRVSPEYLGKVIDERIPCGRFLTKERRNWVAVDNSTGDAWTEEFSRKRQAIRWLRGKFEVN